MCHKKNRTRFHLSSIKNVSSFTHGKNGLRKNLSPKYQPSTGFTSNACFYISLHANFFHLVKIRTILTVKGEPNIEPPHWVDKTRHICIHLSHFLPFSSRLITFLCSVNDIIDCKIVLPVSTKLLSCWNTMIRNWSPPSASINAKLLYHFSVLHFSGCSGFNQELANTEATYFCWQNTCS